MFRAICMVLFLILILPLQVNAGTAPINVVATIFPLSDIVRQVGGNRVLVVTLLPSGASEHTYEPTAVQMRHVSKAALYVRVGAGMDVWGDRLMASAKAPLTVTATQGIPLMPLTMEEMGGEPGHDDHAHGGGDPHVWLDPILVRDQLVPKVLEALVKLSPADAKLFKANAKRFTKELTALDREMAKTIGAFRLKDFIAMHSAWGYLARRYGLRQVAAVEPFPGKEPSARYIAQLVRLARKEGVTTVFAEPQLSPKGAEVIASELKGRVLVLDPLGGENVPGRDSFLALMRYNLSILAGGMRQ